MAITGDPAMIERKYQERKTLDLLDELARVLGYNDGISLGQANDILSQAIRTIKDRAEIVEDLERTISAAETGTPFGMIREIREKIEKGEEYRTTLVEIRRELGELTGMKDQGATITEMIEQLRADTIRRAVLSIQIPEHENCRDFDRHLTPPRPLYGPPPIETGITFSTFLAELVEFQAAAQLPKDLPSMVRKAGEEAGELGQAVAEFASAAGVTGNARPYLQGVREEAADLVVVGVRALVNTGGLGEVVSTLLDNLRRKAEKYRRGENRIGGRP